MINFVELDAHSSIAVLSRRLADIARRQNSPRTGTQPMLPGMKQRALG